MCSTQAACRPACPPATVSIRNTPSSPQLPPGAAPARPPPPPAAPCCPQLCGTGRPRCSTARQAGAARMLSHGRFQGTGCARQSQAQHCNLRATLSALNQGTRSSGTSTQHAPGAEWPEHAACMWPAPWCPALQHTTQQACDLVCGRRPAAQLVHGSQLVQTEGSQTTLEWRLPDMPLA